jgi:hypothetical protein
MMYTSPTPSRTLMKAIVHYEDVGFLEAPTIEGDEFLLGDWFPSDAFSSGSDSLLPSPSTVYRSTVKPSGPTRSHRVVDPSPEPAIAGACHRFDACCEH